MHRIDGPGHVLNRFSEGNPQTGQRATKVTADWLNDLQENILEVLEQAAIAPAKGNDQQLYLAIVALINSAIAGLGGGGGGGTVPITRLINSAGLLIGGGALANDLNLSVPKATGPEVLAGIDDSKAITPAGLAAAFVAVWGAAGYVKFPGGPIMQWMNGTANGGGTTIFTLPLAFPNANLWAGVEGGMASTGTDRNNPFVSGRGLSTVSVFNTNVSSLGVTLFAFGH